MAESGRTVVVIGAGFSGAVTAAHLLRRGIGAPLRVVLINRSDRVARGVAYGTRCAAHVLNVPAGRMSAFADDEGAFLDFARERDPSVGGGSFLPRMLYGEYLERVLERAERGAPPGATLERVVGVARAIEPAVGDAQAWVVLADRTRILADRVVIALGNHPPANPAVADTRFYDDPRYIGDPWAPEATDIIGDDDTVLMIGTGLTMMDIALGLRERGVRGPMHAVSRRGLLPLPHRSPGHPPAYDHLPPGLVTGPRTAAGYLRAVRAHVEHLAKQGIDWREVINSLRPITPELWQALSAREKARFLRHVRPYWEVHRHRAAPELHAALTRLVADGSLAVHAGRVRRFLARDAAVDVELRRRDGGAEHIRTTWVINCTGPESNAKTLRDPLIDDLRGRGLVRADGLGLGLETADDAALLDIEGRPSRILYLVGPLLRAKFWEATAVPELRLHAARLASTLVASLAEAPHEVGRRSRWQSPVLG